jgi:hypothetical protein
MGEEGGGPARDAGATRPAICRYAVQAAGSRQRAGSRGQQAGEGALPCLAHPLASEKVEDIS